MRKSASHLLAAALTINIALWGADGFYRNRMLPAMLHMKEAVLRKDLRIMRRMIDQYAAHEQRAPRSLRDLVDAGYLPEIPRDPMTDSAETWEVIIEEDPISLTGERGIVDVKSGSTGTDSSGESRYSDW